MQLLFCVRWEVSYPAISSQHIAATFISIIHAVNVFTCYSRSAERVGQGHSHLGHSISLQQRVTCDLLPALHYRRRQSSRTTHKQPTDTSHYRWLTDWAVVLRPAQHKVGHFGDVSPSQSFGLVWKKLNLTQQKHAFTSQEKCTTTQNKHKKTKTRFKWIPLKWITCLNRYHLSGPVWTQCKV